MRSTEMLWFEDVSAINEPVLSFPVLGRISMKQFFILGVTGMMTYGLFSATHGLVSAAPISIGAFLALVKPRVGSTESMLLSAMLFLFGRRAGKKKKFGIKKPGGKLVKADKKPSLQDKPVEEPQDKTGTKTTSDNPKPSRFKIRLVGPEGKLVVSKRSKIPLGSAHIDSVTIDITGEIEGVVPKTPGQKGTAATTTGRKRLPFFFFKWLR